MIFNIYLLLFLFPFIQHGDQVIDSGHITPEAVLESVDCTFNGITLYGKVKVVESFPDLKVKVVNSFPDLKVKTVDSFANDCGEWEFVESFPDFTIQFVEDFPDIEIKFVDSFPGLP